MSENEVMRSNWTCVVYDALPPVRVTGRHSALLALATLALAFAPALSISAQDQPPPAPTDRTTHQTFLYFLFGGGGIVGIACTVPILAMSVAAVAMVIEHLFTLRRSVLIPHGLAEDVYDQIANEQYAQAEQQCKLHPSMLGEVILAGLRHARFGFATAEKAMEDALHAHSARLLRKVDVLSVIANIATLLGLFGTVVGLVIAFKRVADTQGVARASDLASGIYLALMTTIEGLAVAIPSVAAYAFFKHRADQLVADAAVLADYAFLSFKTERTSRRTAAPGS